MNDPMAVTCPRCKAKPGHKCTTPGGNPTYQTHMARQAEAEKPIVTKTGKVLTDADIEALADEAEAGYDVTHLKPLKIRWGLPSKLDHKVRARSYIWCDHHGSIHQTNQDPFGEGYEGEDVCAPDQWRRVYIESDDKAETF